MAFREYKIGARCFAIGFGMSMLITLYMPTVDITTIASTQIGLEKQLSAGNNAGFNLQDPRLRGKNKPITVKLDDDSFAYVYKAGVRFPSGFRHEKVLGPGVADLSVSKGQIKKASESEGAVFVIRKAMFNGKNTPYIENATATRGWKPEAVLAKAGAANQLHIGAGKTMFIREGCWWCHTLLPEQTQDWQYFGMPPRLGDFNGESPTAFGSDRKAPDLLHVGSRNSSREWMTMHFFNPRLVQPHSIMPRFDYLWGEVDANGKAIDYDKWRTEYTEYTKGERVYAPDVPTPAADSDARWLMDYMLSLK